MFLDLLKAKVESVSAHFENARAGAHLRVGPLSLCSTWVVLGHHWTDNRYIASCNFSEMKHVNTGCKFLHQQWFVS